MDREEMPFNRAERDWVHRAANNTDTTVAFGSTKNLSPVGTVIFANCPFPTLDEDASETRPITIGEGFCLFIPHTIFCCAYLKNNVCATF
jgi:hypothetical protein